MGRMRRGWELTKQSWAVIRGDRSLVLFPVIGAIAGVLCAAVFFGVGAGLIATDDLEVVGIVVAVIGLYVLTVIAIFCGVALSACAARALEGHDTTVGEGIAAARGHLGAICSWAAIQLLVGAAITAIQSLLREGAGAVVGAIFGGLANFAWTVATFFVIPVIALEGLGPRAALKRSTAIIRERWGEGVTGAAAVGAIVFVAGFLPGAVLVAGGIALGGPGGIVLAALGAIVLVIAALLQTTIMAVFKVALFRFATQEQVLGPFDRAQLELAFVPRKASR